MIFTRRSAVVWLLTLLAGCSVYRNAWRTVVREPREYCWKHDKKLSVAVYQYWADQAWLEQCGPEMAEMDAGDYGAGFCDGFVDYCYLDGSGDPPPVPPRRYWAACCRTAEGRERANQWAAGYRHGAETARNGGYRDRAVLPSSLGLATCNVGFPLSIEPAPAAAEDPDASYEVVPTPTVPGPMMPQNPFADDLPPSGASATDRADVPPSVFPPPPEPQ